MTPGRSVFASRPGYGIIQAMRSAFSLGSRWLCCLVVALLAATLCACGGGGGTSTAAGSGAPTSISFGVTTFAVAPGFQLNLRALARYSDGSTQDITGISSWVSSNPAAATVDPALGIVQGIAAGQTTVTVTYKGVTASVQIPVGVILEAIDVIVPNMLGIGINASFQLSALGQFTDAARDISQTVTWTSSNPAVASVSNQAGQQGLTTGLAPGPVTITARSGSIATTVSLTVLPMQALESSQSNQTVVQFGGLGVDASGQALAVWNHRLAAAGTADLLYSKQSPSIGWTPAAPIRTVSQVELSSPPSVATNAGGLAITAWHQIDGLYAATYSPATGWNAPVRVAVQSVDEPDLQLGVGIDAAGNALVTWKADASAGMTASAFDSASGTWSAPVIVPGSDAPQCLLEQARLSMSATGNAVLAWTRNCVSSGVPSTNAQELLVSGWTTRGGWRPSTSMVTSPSLIEFAVATNDAGDAQVAWTVNELTAAPSAQSPFVGSVFARRLSASSGWGPNQTIATGLTRQPVQPMTAINIQGSAVLAWRNVFDQSVSAAASDTNGVWTQPIDLYLPPIGEAGDPTVLKPCMTDDGRALIPWIVSDLGLLGQVATARHVPSTGWEQMQVLAYTGRRGLVTNVDFEFNRQGRGALLWLEGAAAGFNLYGYAFSF